MGNNDVRSNSAFDPLLSLHCSFLDMPSGWTSPRGHTNCPRFSDLDSTVLSKEFPTTTEMLIS